MNEDDKKTETEVTPEGAVEIQEEDLDQASGGVGYLKMPTDQLKIKTVDTSLKLNTQFGDGSVKPSGEITQKF